MRLSLFIVLFITVLPLNGQNIIFTDSLCIGENTGISIDEDLDYTEWDFCLGGFNTDYPKETITNVPNLSNGYGIEVVSEDGNFHGFIIDRNNKLIRLDFGSNLSSDPVINDLGNISGMFSNQEDISIIKFNGIWYGIIGYGVNGGSLKKITFGNHITNMPSIKNIGSFGRVGRIRQVELLNEEGDLLLVFSDYARKINIVNFGNSFPDTTLAANVVSSPNFPQINLITGFDIAKVQDNYFVHVVGILESKVLRLNYGLSLLNAPIVEAEYIFAGWDFIFDIDLVKEGNNYYGIVSSERQGTKVFDFGNLLTPKTPERKIYSSELPISLAIKSFRHNGNNYVFGTQSNKLYRFLFEDDCNSSISFATGNNLSNSFSNAGFNKFWFQGKNVDGQTISIVDSIYIKNVTSPEIDFNFSINRCIDSEINMAHSSNQNIAELNWSFGDGNHSTQPNPTYHYPTSGTYNVRLDAESDNGCSNYMEKPITIYPEPIPAFTFPEGTLCSNSSIPFTNTSETGSAEDVIQWQWDFNEEGVSDQKDTEFNFSQGGAKMVSLTAAIPGCAPKTTKWFNVTAGPEVQFAVQNQCFGEELQFVNQSSGEGITQHHWLLGNGQTSFDLAPSLVYDTAGTYPVQLEVTNEMGCTNSMEKDILVHFAPVADMDYGLLCSSGTQFIDQSTVNRANLTLWEWSILQEGQYQILSNEKNPMIETGTAGVHRLKLLVASNFGCSDSIEVEIDALPGPEADFATSAICVGDSVLFTDLSASLQNNPVTQWYWNINGKGFFTQQPKSLFQTPGAYQVSLKVDAQNLCSDMITKTVVVPRLPVPVFTTSKLCQNEHILFTDKSFSPDDPVKSWEWDFAGLATKTGPQAQFQFPTAKDHAVKLSVVTENGCRQFMVNTVSINPAPKAKFSLYPAVGTVPLPVTLENQSIGAVNYRWTFGEHADSVVTDFQPDYTYQSLGEHEIKLLAISDKGCRDSVSQMISIRLPLLDVELERILKVVNNGELQLVTRINNLGSLIIQDMDLVIDLGSIKLRESFPEILEAGEGVNHPLNFRISDFIAQGLEYVCITLEPRMPGNQEVSLENNKMCISLNELFSILEPFPNPANTELNISYIATNTSDGVSMLVADLTGRVVLDKKVQPQQTGMNHHLLDVRGLSGGMYVIKIAVNDKVIIRRVLVER